MRTCKVEDCERRYCAMELCRYHYMRKWRAENPDREQDYYRKHKNKILARNKARYWSDEEFRERRRASAREYARRKRAEQ